MTLPSFGLFRHTEGKVHLVLVDGSTAKTMCTRHAMRHGEMVDPATPLNCAGCEKGGWVRNFKYSPKFPGNTYVSVASLHGGLLQ